VSTQLPFTGTLSVIPFFKKKGKYEYCFVSIPLNYWLSTIVGFWTRLTIFAMYLPFKKALAQSFARHCCSSKNKFVQTKVFKFLNFFKAKKAELRGAHF